MLPILRTTLLGGAFAAAAFLTGFMVPEYTRPHLAQFPSPSRGPLQDIAEHPEWKQMLQIAALRRAAELDRLRDLPSEDATLIGLPKSRPDAEPEDVTSSVTDAPQNTMQVDIGETSSVELPVGTPRLGPQVTPPADKPQSLEPARRSEIKPARKHRRARARAPGRPSEQTTDPLAALFGASPPTAGSTP
ncbi:MAG: hypothetical protein JO205_06895 [Pseudolabrys sp.]|nr:hypothetical protein [Pseudolabrys sp.]